MTPDRLQAWRETVLPVLERLCKLQEEVSVRFLEHQDANDCFCGEGGMWVQTDRHPRLFWRSDQTAVDFIESVVRKRLDEIDRSREGGEHE